MRKLVSGFGKKRVYTGLRKPCNTFMQQQILDSSKLKRFADDNSNLIKMAESSPNG